MRFLELAMVLVLLYGCSPSPTQVNFETSVDSSVTPDIAASIVGFAVLVTGGSGTLFFPPGCTEECDLCTPVKFCRSAAAECLFSRDQGHFEILLPHSTAGLPDGGPAEVALCALDTTQAVVASGQSVEFTNGGGNSASTEIVLRATADSCDLLPTICVK